MTDSYLLPLFDSLSAAAARSGVGATLWVADEQMIDVPAAAGIQLLTNRWDLYRRAQAQGLTAQLSDFDFSGWAPGALGCVGYRISKEKAIVHHVINEALARLPPGGQLWLAGHKQEGIRTYLDKAAALAGRSPQLHRLGGGGLLACVERGESLGTPLDDQHYADWRRVEADPALWTKPGIFGWQRIDAGSALLVDQLATACPTPPQRVLDLGCGYGYLAASAARQWPRATVIATDSNIAAVAAAARNLAEQLPREQWHAVAGDCGDQVEGQVDAVLCNPPFHRGFATEADLTERFLAAAAAKLSRGGGALFVVNRFIPLVARSRRYFAGADVVADDGRFLVVFLRR